MLRVLLGIVLALGVSVNLARAGEVVATDEANAPFMYAKSGQAVGIYPSLLAEAFKRAGVEVAVQAMPWTRAVAGLDEGKNGVGGIYQNSERLKKYDYSDKLFDEVIQVFVAKDKPIDFTGIDSLKGKTVGVIRGWSYGEEFDAAVKAGAIKTEATEGDALNLKKLSLGRIDAVVAVREAGAAAIAAEALGEKVVAVGKPLSSTASYLAFAKSANKAEVIAKFNAALAAMRTDGTYDKMVAEGVK